MKEQLKPKDPNAMNDQCDRQETAAEWKEAHSRVKAYLQALQVANQEQQDHIVSIVLDRAAVKREENPGLSLTALAMDEIRSLSEHWFGNLLATRERAAVRGVVSLLAIGATEKWPSVFLAENVPSDFRSAITQCDVRGAPDLKVSRMVPQPFGHPLQDSSLRGLVREFAPLITEVLAFVLSGFSLFSGDRVR